MITAIIIWWYDQDYNIDSRHLSLFRVFFCLYAILIQGIPTYLWISSNHVLPFFPPEISFGIFFKTLPSTFFFGAITLLIYLLFSCLLFGLFTKYSSIILSILILTGHTFKYSFGKIDHDIFFALLPLLLCNSGWGNHFSLDAIKNKKIDVPKIFSVRYIALFFGYAMFIAGVSKYLGGWLNLDSQAIYYHIFRYQAFANPTPLASSFVIKYCNSNWFEFFDFLIVFFEIGFLLAVIKPIIFRFFISAALIFHFTNFITLGIGFLGNIPLYLLFINWKYMFDLSKQKKLISILNSFINYRNFITISFLLFGQFIILHSIDFSPPLLQTSILKTIMMVFECSNHYKWIALPILLTLIILSPKLYMNKK